MKWNTKIKAGALQFVLFMGVVIALLLLTFITLAQTNSLFGKKTELLVETIKSADLGLSMALKSNMVLNDSLDIELPGDSPIEVRALRQYWGIFEKYTVLAKSKKNRFVKSVLAGSSSSEMLPALYLEDNQRPLIIVGNAKITGDAFLPKQGIRPGNIAGNSFYGTSMVNGRQRQSRSSLPQLNSEFVQRVNQFSRNRIPNKNNQNLKLERGLKATNSFEAPTKTIEGSEIILSGVFLSGNIEVHATRRIIVEATSQLQDIVLSAPEIIVKKGVVGSFQAIASKNIEVGRNCILEYPSALVVNHSTTNNQNANTVRKPDISVGQKSIVKGSIVYLMKGEKQQRFHPQIKIDTDAVVWGEVYCAQNLELKGKVFGSVNTYGFVALESGSIYQNHFFNGTIDSSRLPREYTGLPLTNNTSFKAITKWLY
ncbi:hypothetical protein [Maribacter sp. 2308TA10-17]|uniref:hypothetical protein n=1 Tax=Maribacter sp. 2308TA10-17 TaxID=3386276 RepID=UPI0039BCC9FF